MNKYESFLERTTIKLYKEIARCHDLEKELEYAVKASICVDLVIFMIEALNKLNQQQITVETTDNLVDALGGVFPLTIFYTVRDFAYSQEEAVALLANFYREGDDPDELVGTRFDFKTLMRGLYNFRAKEYFAEEREPIMMVSAVVPMMIRHVKVDNKDMELLQAIDQILVDCMGHIPNLVGSKSHALSKKLKHSRKQSSSVHTPRDHTVICSGCSTKTRIKKDIGKYHCPKCSSLLVYVKDSLTAHYVGAEETAEAAKKNKPQSDGNFDHFDNKIRATRGRCANCGQSTFGVVGEDRCPDCNAILVKQKEKKAAPEKSTKSKLNNKNSTSQQNDDHNTPGLIDNIIWFIKSVGLVTTIWTISMSLMITLSSNVDQTAGVIIAGVMFFGTFYFISTLEGFGDPPSQYHYKESFELAFGFAWVMFGPTLGAMVAMFLFWS